MPKMIDPKVKERCVQQILEHVAEYPNPMIVASFDDCRAAGHAVESACRVLSEQGCQIAARTYRAWAGTSQLFAARTVSDEIVMDAVHDTAWTVHANGPLAGVRRLTPARLYGRRKMTALINGTLPNTSPGAVDRTAKVLGLNEIRRGKGVRIMIPAKEGGRGSRTCRSSSPGTRRFART